MITYNPPMDGSRRQVELEIPEDLYRVCRKRQKDSARRARTQRQLSVKLRRYVREGARKLGLELDDNLEPVAIPGLMNAETVRRDAEEIVERLSAEYLRGRFSRIVSEAAEESSAVPPERPKPVRRAPELPKKKPPAGVWPPRRTDGKNPAEAKAEPPFPAFPEIRSEGGTLEGSPVGSEPKDVPEITDAPGSSLAVADSAACEEIAGAAAAAKTNGAEISIRSESGSRARTISNEPGIGFAEASPNGPDSVLWDEIEALENRAKHWQTECDAARTALFEANERARRAEEALLGRPNGTQTDDAPRVLARLLLHPNTRVTLTEALSTASSLYPDRMVVLPSAFESAEKLDPVSTRGGRLLKLLVKLTTDYYDVLTEKGDAEARKVFSPAEYSACESDTVRTGGLGRMRDFVYAGEKIRMEQHLKIGIAANTSVTLRVYFAWIAEERKFVVGYCGEHLPVASHRT